MILKEHGHVHFIGVAGSGISALAILLAERGYQVTGSDRQDSVLLDDVRKAGVQVVIDHAAGHIQKSDLVVRSSAIPDTNVEVQAARQAGIPVLKRVDFLGEITRGYRTIALAGTHGKTTTTSMVAWVLNQAGLDPSFIIGGVARDLGTNAHAGRGTYFVIEADEYDRMFLGLKPSISVITNIEHDHPDCYPTMGDFNQAFVEFANRLEPEGKLVVCRDDPGAERLGHRPEFVQRRIGYGLSNTEETGSTDYLAEGWIVNETGGFDFQVLQGNRKLGPFRLVVPGLHNVRNALAAIVIADILEIPMEKVTAALAVFQGAGRRFEVVGNQAGVTVINDYGHHPGEIRATLEAAKARYPGQTIWAVWQPHTYSRTQVLWEQFATCFTDAERVLILDVFGAREQAPQGFSMGERVRKIKHPSVNFIPSIDETAHFLAKEVKPGDVVIVLSAGDADRVSTLLLQALAQGDGAER